MKLFSNNIVPYASAEGDKIYPIVVDIKKGIKSGEAISFVTADNQVGVITVDFMDGNSSYSIEGCIVTSTIRRPDGTVLEIPCDIISQSIIEIPLGINGTYQEGVHTFDLKIVRGNGKVIGVPTMSYSVSGSLSSDDVVEGDDRLPVLTMVLDNAQDKLTRLDRAIAGATNDLEVKEARDGEVTLNARLERDLEKGKIHFVDVEGSSISTDSEEGYFENVEIHGNTWQDANNLSDIRSVGTKVEGQELYEIDVVSCGKNLFDGSISNKTDNSFDFSVPVHICEGEYRISFTSNVSYSGNSVYLKSVNPSYNRFLGMVTNRNGSVSGNLTINADDMNTIKSSTKGLRFSIYRADGISDIPTDILITQSDDLSYEPYQEDKLTILSPTPLEKVGDIADRIICKDGVWGVEKNINTIQLNTTTCPKRYASLVCKNGIKLNLTPPNDALMGAKILNGMSDIYHMPSRESDMHDGIMETGTHHAGGITKDGYLRIFLYNIFTEQNGFDFVDSSGGILKYITTQPTFIPLPHDQQVKLRTFANKTNISFLTEIEGTIKAQVPKSLGATVNTHTTQIDNLNKELDRVKKLEESTVSTITSDKGFTTIAETTGGYFEDVKIEGRTLVNRFISRGITDTGSAIVNSNSNTTLTGTFTVILNDMSKKCNLDIVSISSGGWIRSVSSNNINKGILVTLKEDEYIGSIFGRYDDGWTSSDSDNFKKALILEGDHTDKDISYFEGLKSVGQDSDEISVSSVNDRYVHEIAMSTNRIDYVLKKNIYSNEIVRNKTSKKIKLLCFDSNSKTWVKDVDLDAYSTYTVEDGLYIWKVSITIQLGWETNKITKRLDELIEVNIFEIDKKQILYFNPNTQTWETPILREWDSIEKHSDGKYYYHKRSGEIVLNGSEEWQIRKEKTNTIVFRIYNYSGYKITNTYICDKFSFVNVMDIIDEEGLAFDASGNPHVGINKSRLSNTDLSSFKSWLQANPVTAVYELAQEEVYECTNLDLITYQNETNLIVSSGAIQPKITLKVLSNISNVVKLLQEKVSVLENKFIQGLKQVLAGDMYSLAHLLYPEDFENNHEIQTLEL